MTWIKSIAALVAAFALLFFVIWLTKMDSCNEPAQPAIDTQKHDSIKKAGDSVAIHWEQTAERLQRDSVNLVHKVDSITIIKNYNEDLLIKSRQTTGQTASNVQQAWQHNDTLAYETNCNALAKQVVDQNTRIDSFREAVTSLLFSKDSLSIMLATRLDTASSTIRLYQHLLAGEQDYSMGLLNRLGQELKNSKKKFSFGPSISYGIQGDGKLGPQAGFSITYSLIKF